MGLERYFENALQFSFLDNHGLRFDDARIVRQGHDVSPLETEIFLQIIPDLFLEIPGQNENMSGFSGHYRLRLLYRNAGTGGISSLFQGIFIGDNRQTAPVYAAEIQKSRAPGRGAVADNESVRIGLFGLIQHFIQLIPMGNGTGGMNPCQEAKEFNPIFSSLSL